MSERASVERDLEFVRNVVERSDRRRGGAAIYALWGILVLVGFPLVDFAPSAAGLMWTIAAPVGTVLSFFLGRSLAKRVGVADGGLAARYMLHWVALLLAMAAVYPLVAMGIVSGRGAGAVLLLLLAFAYVLAGVHLERPLLWVGLVIALGYPIVVLVDQYAWTAIGIVVGAALLLTALLQVRKGERQD